MPFPTLPLVKVWLLFFKSYPPTSHENEFRHDRHNVLYDVYEVHHVYAGVYFPYHQYDINKCPYAINGEFSGTE